MKFSIVIKQLTLACIVGLGVVGTSAQAATFDLAFNGDTSVSNHSVFTSGSSTWDVTLHAGISLVSVNGAPASSVILSQGDVVNATVTFSSPISTPVPADAVGTSLTLLLEGSGFDGSPVETAGASASATLGGSSIGGDTHPGCGTSSQICDGGLSFGAGTVTSVSLDTYTDSFTLTTLSSPVVINEAALEVASSSPLVVPEPSTEALAVLGGFAVLTQVLRRKA